MSGAHYGDVSISLTFTRKAILHSIEMQFITRQENEVAQLGNHRSTHRSWGLTALVGLLATILLLPQAASASTDKNQVPTIESAIGTPAAYYPASQILAYGQGHASNWPIRRGYFDGKKGFGYDKSYHKHGIWNLKTMSWAMGSPTIKVEGTQRAMTSYARKLRCDDKLVNCIVDKQIQVKAVVETAYKQSYYGQPINGRLGLMTVYCIGPTVCPSWVNNVTSGCAAALGSTPGGEHEVITYSYKPVKVGTTISKAALEKEIASRK